MIILIVEHPIKNKSIVACYTASIEAPKCDALEACFKKERNYPTLREGLRQNKIRKGK